MVRIMYDSVNASAIPRDAQMVAGYVNGIYQWSDADWNLFPRAVHVGIAVRASFNGGIVLDVERGDASPQEAPNWAQMRRRAGVDPTIYCSESVWSQVRDAFIATGIPEPHYWIAHYGAVAIPSGAVALQNTNTAAWDRSLVADYWPGVDDMPFTPDDFAHFMWGNVFDTNGNRNYAQYIKDMQASINAIQQQLNTLTASLPGLVQQAVQQHISIDGTVHIGPASEPVQP